MLTEIQSPNLREKYYIYEHKSGLKVHIFPKNMSVTYALFGTHYGSVDNTFRLPGQTQWRRVPAGIAHYLEHRMFTQPDGSDITERFSEYGADVNAYTAHTRTMYLFSCTDRFRDSLGALVELVTKPYFTDELVEKERGIIVEEIKMCRDNPYERCFYSLLGAMYENNPIKIDIAGSEESVAEIDAGLLNECYRAFYTPDRMTMVVCGNVTPEEVIKVVDSTLPDDFEPCAVECFTPKEKDEVVSGYTELSMPVSKPIFSIGVKDNAFLGDAKARTKRDAAMSILSELLFSGSGKLYNRLFEGGKMTSEFSAGYTITDRAAFLMISGEADDPKEIREEILKELRKLQENGVDQNDFRRCQRVLYADFVMSFDSTSEIANNMVDFIFDGYNIFDYGEELLSVTASDIDSLLSTFFDESHISMAVVRPMEEVQNKQGENNG